MAKYRKYSKEFKLQGACLLCQLYIDGRIYFLRCPPLYISAQMRPGLVPNQQDLPIFLLFWRDRLGADEIKALIAWSNMLI